MLSIVLTTAVISTVWTAVPGHQLTDQCFYKCNVDLTLDLHLLAKPEYTTSDLNDRFIYSPCKPLHHDGCQGATVCSIQSDTASSLGDQGDVQASCSNDSLSLLFTAGTSTTSITLECSESISALKIGHKKSSHYAFSLSDPYICWAFKQSTNCAGAELREPIINNENTIAHDTTAIENNENAMLINKQETQSTTNTITTATTDSTLTPTTDSTLTPTTDSTLPPTTDSTLTPTTDSTLMPTTDSTSTPTTDSTLTPTTDSTLTPTTDSTLTPTTDSTLTPTTDSTLTPTTDSTLTPTKDSTLTPTTDSKTSQTTNNITASSDPTSVPIVIISTPHHTVHSQSTKNASTDVTATTNASRTTPKPFVTTRHHGNAVSFQLSHALLVGTLAMVLVLQR